MPARTTTSRFSDQRSGDIRFFVLNGSEDLGGAIADQFGLPSSPLEERNFEDGEHKTRSLASVSGCDVYVIHSLHGGPVQTAGEKLCRLLFFCGSLKDGGARRVTAVTPYLCFARKDRRTKWNDPVTIRYVAQLIEAVGIDAVVTLEVHNDAAFENAFRCRSIALSAAPIFADYVATLCGEVPVVVMSPDTGGAKRAESMRQMLEHRLARPVGFAFSEKHRSEGLVSGDLFAGDVAGKLVLVVDDIISTGHTMARAAHAARIAGATSVHLLATHGLFMPGCHQVLASPDVDSVAITNTVPPFRLGPTSGLKPVHIFSAAPLIATALKALAYNEPLDALS
jgi:ribose-phosphate pyrophosphokinase